MKWFTRFFLSLILILFSGNAYLEARTFQLGAKPILTGQAEHIFLANAQQDRLPFSIDYTHLYRLVQDLPEFVDENRDEEDDEPFSVKKCLRDGINYFNLFNSPSIRRSAGVVWKRSYFTKQFPYSVIHRHILFRMFRV